MQRQLLSLDEPALRFDDCEGWRAAQERWARFHLPRFDAHDWRCKMAFWSAAWHAVYTDHVRLGRGVMVPGSRPWLDAIMRRDGNTGTSEPLLAGIHSDIDPERWPELAERADEALQAFANYYAIGQIHWTMQMIPERLRDADHDERFAAICDRQAMLKTMLRGKRRAYMALRDRLWGGSVEPRDGKTFVPKAASRPVGRSVRTCMFCAMPGGKHDPSCIAGINERIGL